MKKLLIIILILILPIIVYAADLFSDDFEDGTTDAWSSVTDADSDMTVAEAAALHGTYGLNFLIDDQNDMWCQDDTPNAETRYRCRFYFDPNSLSMSNNNEFYLTLGFGSGSCFNLKFIYLDAVGGYRLVSTIYPDTGWTDSNYDISDGLHCIETDWKASSAPGANDGFFRTWVDGELVGDTQDVDNDTKDLGSVRFGVHSTISAGLSGTVYLDDFASNITGDEIGAFPANLYSNILFIFSDF